MIKLGMGLGRRSGGPNWQKRSLMPGGQGVRGLGQAAVVCMDEDCL